MAKRVKKSAEIRRGELLDHAQSLFFSKGFEATTVADVMERAGVSKGGFYHHFSAKDDLLEAIGARLATETVARLQPALGDRTLDAVTRLNAFLAGGRGIKGEDVAAMRAAFNAVFRPENLTLYHRLDRAVSAVVRPIFVDILQQGMDEGRFRITDATIVAEIVLQLRLSTYDAVARTLDAAGSSDVDDAAAALDERLRQQGIAVDRILGLPDGTIAVGEPGFAKAMLGGVARG